jgi:5-oxoprolinase (ATP-hydrolysing) subunit B
MRIRGYGRSALLVELDSLARVVGLHAALRDDPPRGLVDLVPGARTLLVCFDRRSTTGADLAAKIRARSHEPPLYQPVDEVTVPVRYDGDDLGEVALLSGLNEREVIDYHVRQEYTVAFTGFAPGFYFLSGGHPALQVGRRSSPRSVVQRGAIGLAGEFTGIYPRKGPGGWQIIGHTTARLWDLDKLPSALLAPNTLVRFVEVSA